MHKKTSTCTFLLKLFSFFSLSEDLIVRTGEEEEGKRIVVNSGHYVMPATPKILRGVISVR